MKMVLLILAALCVPLALGYLGVLPGVVVLIAEVAILLIVAWWFDRGRGPGAAPHSWTEPLRPRLPDGRPHHVRAERSDRASLGQARPD